MRPKLERITCGNCHEDMLRRDYIRHLGSEKHKKALLGMIKRDLHVKPKKSNSE